VIVDARLDQEVLDGVAERRAEERREDDSRGNGRPRKCDSEYAA
jgi:hypothetical protein